DPDKDLLDQDCLVKREPTMKSERIPSRKRKKCFCNSEGKRNAQRQYQKKQEKIAVTDTNFSRV
ncbi:unnamed protein product, partial [Nesidiocoris tenuis]